MDFHQLRRFSIQEETVFPIMEVAARGSAEKVQMRQAASEDSEALA